jgi:hypothetical protein
VIGTRTEAERQELRAGLTTLIQVRFEQPEFLPVAGYWKTLRYGLWCNAWLAAVRNKGDFLIPELSNVIPGTPGGGGHFTQNIFLYMNWNNTVILHIFDKANGRKFSNLL